MTRTRRVIKCNKPRQNCEGETTYGYLGKAGFGVHRYCKHCYRWLSTSEEQPDGTLKLLAAAGPKVKYESMP